MAKYNPGGWWNRRAQSRQSFGVTGQLYPGLSLSQQQVAAFMAYKPPVTAKQPKPARVMSEEALRALEVIQRQIVFVYRGAGRYWSDYFMQALCWIDKLVIDELRSFHVIKQYHGVYVAKAAQ